MVWGGVGGLGLVCRSANASGTFPAASRSKGESTSSSAEARKGGAGRGLFTSVVAWGECSGVVSSELVFRGGATNGEGRSGLLEEAAGFMSRELESAPSSILICFPCLELGGGGGFLRAEADVTVANGDEGRTPLRSPDSSASEIS